MYLADSRSTKAAVAPDTGPGRRPAAVPGTVLALGTVSLITDISSEMVTAVLPLYVVAGLGLSPHRGRAFGVHRAMDTTGALLGPLAAFAVLRATVDGYDAVFAVSGCIAALGVLVLVLLVPRRIAPEDTAPPKAGPKLGDSLGLLHRPELRRLTVCAALLGLTTVSDSFLYLLLQRELHLPPHLFPLLPLGTAAAFLLLAIPLGALADRGGRRRLFLAGHGVPLLGYGLLLSPLRGAPVAVAVLVLHGAFYAATDGVLAAAAALAVSAVVASLVLRTVDGVSA
ncbi:MFS transporter [Streptomyces sp. NBC_00133]|uniref:MFS transporter n=1 Tax=Streptomyces sp. NBC_00133 TaxID=2903624 RepID=UPI0032440EF8